MSSHHLLVITRYHAWARNCQLVYTTKFLTASPTFRNSVPIRVNRQCFHSRTSTKKMQNATWEVFVFFSWITFFLPHIFYCRYYPFVLLYPLQPTRQWANYAVYVAYLLSRLQFVIVASFDHTAFMLPVEKRITLALKRRGLAVTCENSPCPHSPSFAFFLEPITCTGNIYRFALALRDCS